MKDKKKISVAVLIWLTKTNNYRLSLAKSLQMQMGFIDFLCYLSAFGKWLFWYRLWIRSEENHVSLDLDERLLWSDDLLRDYYIDDIIRRRQIAHIRNLPLLP